MILLITGGTGSFGNAVLKKYCNDGSFEQIRVFSRDEKKQDDLRKQYDSSKIKFYIGDVRDKDSLRDAIKNTTHVFHAAALKQVPSCEYFPLEALKTNAIGTANVLDVAKEYSVEKVVCLSTDKAAYPINAMGMTKAIMEKIMVAKSRDNDKEKVICGTRYGNVLFSRGSVVPLFIDYIKNKKDITITDENMTRFIMTLDEAVELVNYAFNNGKNGELFVQKSPSCNILDLAYALLTIFESKSKIKLIGVRSGEKLYETLLTKEEAVISIDENRYYRVINNKQHIDYTPYYSRGNNSLLKAQEYNSMNAERLSKESLIELLCKQDYIKNILK